jgi:hypothetical protein
MASNFNKISNLINENNLLNSVTNEGIFPAYSVFNTNLQYTVTEEYYEEGKLHSFNDMPSKIDNFQNNKPKLEIWHHQGKIHRDESKGPSYIEYNLYYQPRIQKYYRYGKIHRKSGPAAIYKYEDEIQARYYQDGKLNKIIDMDEKGKIYNINYYILDKPITQRNFFIFNNILRKGVRKLKHKKRNNLIQSLDKSKIKIKDIQKLIAKLAY